MFKEFLEAIGQIIGLTRESKQHKDDIKNLQDDDKELRDALEAADRRMDDIVRTVDRLAENVKRIEQVFGVHVQYMERQFASEIRRVEDKHAQERRNLALELEKTLLQFERRLPPPSPKGDD